MDGTCAIPVALFYNELGQEFSTVLLLTDT